MVLFIRHSILFLLLSLFATAAEAQVRRIALDNAAGRSSQPQYVNVYEYDYVDTPPQFPGGDRGLINFINKTRIYPYDAYHNHLEDRVICSFIVDDNGKVSNISVIKGIYPSLNEEAVRIIKKMPDWKAGQLNGSNVPVRCILTIAFRL